MCLRVDYVVPLLMSDRQRLCCSHKTSRADHSVSTKMDLQTFDDFPLQIIGVGVKHTFPNDAPVIGKLDHVSLCEDITVSLPTLSS